MPGRSKGRALGLITPPPEKFTVTKPPAIYGGGQDTYRVVAPVKKKKENLYSHKLRKNILYLCYLQNVSLVSAVFYRTISGHQNK
jgi:hypothetical protein